MSIKKALLYKLEKERSILNEMASMSTSGVEILKQSQKVDLLLNQIQKLEVKNDNR